jgi:hypothetical protein
MYFKIYTNEDRHYVTSITVFLITEDRTFYGLVYKPSIILASLTGYGLDDLLVRVLVPVE